MKRNVWKYALSILIICILVIGCKNQYSSILLQNATYGMPGLIEKGKIDNLYIGSSMFRQGIDIVTLEENPESDYYILAYNGNQPVLEYYQLKNLLDHGVKVENLYVDMYTYSAWKDPTVDDAKIFLETDINTKLSIYNMIKSKNIDVKLLWNMFVTSNNELLLFWPINDEIISNQFKNGGTLTKTEARAIETLEQAAIPKIEGSMNPQQKLYLEKIIALANEHEINLTFIETPKYHTVSEDISYLEAMKEYAGLLEEKNINYLVGVQTAGYLGEDASSHMQKYDYDISNNRYFMDTIHLSYEGRRAFSQIVSKY